MNHHFADFDDMIDKGGALHKLRISIGDWSGDGHEKCEHFVLRSSLPKRDLQLAYLQSCAKTGYRFHHNLTLHRTKLSKQDIPDLSKTVALFDRYEDGKLPKEAMAKFLELGCPKELLSLDAAQDPKGIEGWPDDPAPYDALMSPDALAKLLVWFLSLSLPSDWVGSIEDTPEMEALFGWWDENLNFQVGYGLF